MLELEGVSAGYGGGLVLRDLSFSVESGRCSVLLGRNGAGKTTTLKTILGLLTAERGRVSFQGRDITRVPTHRRERAGISFVTSDRGVFGRLTVAQNIALAHRTPDSGGWTVDGVFDFLPVLRDLHPRAAGVLSGGERQMLKLGMALLTNPKLLVLDEPTQGVAPVVMQEMQRQLAELRSAGLTILLSEQNSHFATALADHAIVIEKGEVVSQGDMQELLETSVIEKYLGV